MKLSSLLTAFILIATILPSCEFSCTIGKDTTEEKAKPRKERESGISNGIKVKASGIKVEQAYLILNDGSGERVGEDNKIDFRSGVRLMLEVDNNWVAKDERVWLGASMTVTGENGEKVIDEEDMFAAYETEGLPAKDANIISLSVKFKDRSEEGPLTFDVKYRVWDKKGDAFIEGSYIIHTR